MLRDRLRLLFGGAGLSLGLSLAVAAILVSVHFHQSPSSTQLTWLALMLVLLGLRGLLAWRYVHSDGADLADRHWLYLYRAGSWVTGVLWGLGGLLLYPGAEMSLQVFTLLVLAGVAAGALSAMVADGAAYRGFVLATLVPVTALALAAGGGMQMAVGMLTGLLALFLLRSGQQASATLVGSLALRYENADLLARLDKEKARVVHEGETLLSGVLSCAPIALWTVAPDGTIGTLQGHRLARRTTMRMPKRGDNLFQVFAAEPAIVAATQRALRGERLVTEVELAGNAYEIHYSPLDDPDGSQAGAIGVAIDISERKRNEQELIQSAHFDALTGLPNRALITRQIEHALDQARRQERCVALLFLDLDHFKAVNDTMGHKAGDALLCDAAERLRRTLREADLPARLGGDEFLVVGENLQRPTDAEVVAHRVVSAFRRPFLLEGREFYISASVGVALFPQDGGDAAQLLQCADTAMY
jgi:diguanylate cyclase (GGDEF)-like protein